MRYHSKRNQKHRGKKILLNEMALLNEKRLKEKAQKQGIMNQ